MQRLNLIVLFACVLFVASAASAQVGTPKTLDEQVEQAIQKGKAHLYSLQLADGSWGPFGKDKDYLTYNLSGPTALALYALLEAGENPQNEKIKKGLDWMAVQKATRTYELGLRCCVWTLANKPTGGKYRKVLEQDAKQLENSTANGSYYYWSMGDHKSAGDNSNSQYGVLGVWMATRGAYEASNEYWKLVQTHWLNTQNADGGWGYTGGSQSAGAMTAAGIATIFVCYDNLYASAFIKCQGGGSFAPLKRGLDWMDKNFAGLMANRRMGHADLYYTLYGVERVGLASGYKYFGTTDWYKLGAQRLLDTGKEGKWAGTWGDVEGTGYALLFLSRGRNAVLFNKLEFPSQEGGTTSSNDWNSRPRDLANFTAWASMMYETTVNWQIINLKVPVSEWHDAPILYIAGSKKPKMSEDDIAKLRTYVLQGGTIFSCTQCSGSGFRNGIRDVYKKMFPEYQLTKLPAGHDIYGKKVANPLTGGKPEFWVISNGVRPLVIHTDEDLPKDWQLNRTGLRINQFYAGVNVYNYITDKGAGLRKRGAHNWPDDPNITPKATINVVRLQWKGSWDPEPLALERFSRMFLAQTGYKVEVLKSVPVSKVTVSGANLAILSGLGELELSESEKDAIKSFMNRGGTVLVDAAGGDATFYRSAERLLEDMFGSDEVRRLASSTPLYNATSMEDGKIGTVKYRRKTGERLLDAKEAMLKGVAVKDNDKERAALILSREDLTCAGLVGYYSYTADGYDPGDGYKGTAYRLMRNIVLYAAGKDQSTEAPATVPAVPTDPNTPPATTAVTPAAPK